MSKLISKISLSILTVLIAVVVICTTVHARSSYPSVVGDGSTPTVCAHNHLVSGFGCRGSYCDKVEIVCNDNYNYNGSIVHNKRYWLRRVSDESSRNYRECENGDYFSGVFVYGSYSDNLNFECTGGTVGGRAMQWRDCRWSGWVSDEGSGFLGFERDYYAVGVYCWGRYCDYKNFKICKPR